MTINNNQVGRPVIEFDQAQLDQITQLAKIGCNNREIYGVLGVTASTFTRLLNRDPRVQAAIDAGQAELHMKLRRYQIELACSGSVPMLIHLGKAILGQTPAAPAIDHNESPLSQFLPRAETIKGLPEK